MLNDLFTGAGEWRGKNTLQDPEMGMQPVTTDSSAAVTPLLDGRFVRIDYTWSYKGTPQSGSMLIGHQKKAGRVTLHWIDSWHNGEKVMACEGAADGGVVDVRGSYPAPTGPDWGWRIVIAPAAGALAVRMANISPAGEEYPAVEAHYTKA